MVLGKPEIEHYAAWRRETDQRVLAVLEIDPNRHRLYELAQCVRVAKLIS